MAASWRTLDSVLSHCEEAKPTKQTMDCFAVLAMTFALVAPGANADDNATELGGHTKFRVVGQSYPIAGSSSIDAFGELRLNFSAKQERWSAHADYQLFAVNSEFLPLGLPDDGARAFDATKIIDDSGDWAILHRLDRLWVGHTGEKTTVRIGRQALSWGNGLFFHPMDLVNPFEATAIDTEYKAGDDMLYLQYLRDNGHDLQGAAVFRRDPESGNVDSDRATIALKYHGFAGAHEFDVLVAENNGDPTLGIGGTRSIGGAVWRGDVVVSDVSDESVVEVVTNLSYSWTWDEKNVSGAAEYYYDGDDGHFLAGSLMIEMSPLWILTPTLVSRADEPSALIQIVTQYSLSDNTTFLGSLNVPLGADGTRFGGAETPAPNRYQSFEAGIFAQLAWYF